MFKRIVLIVFIVVPLMSYAAPKPRIAICHFQDEETGEFKFKFKNLPEPASNAHLARHVSDVAVIPGETVTTEVDGVIITLDEDCDIIPE